MMQLLLGDKHAQYVTSPSSTLRSVSELPIYIARLSIGSPSMATPPWPIRAPLAHTHYDHGSSCACTHVNVGKQWARTAVAMMHVPTAYVLS
jgi:hypothetical protein